MYYKMQQIYEEKEEQELFGDSPVIGPLRQLPIGQILLVVKKRDRRQNNHYP